MAGRLGPVELYCDAPPYEVVISCEELGFFAPLDVRWERIGNLRARRQSALAKRVLWWAWLLQRPGKAQHCGCRKRMPELRWYRFVYPSGGECDYVLGQCRRCRTVYWDELQSLLKGSAYGITFKALS